MLQHLMGVYDVETVRRELECVGVTDREVDRFAPLALGLRAGVRQRVLRRLQRRDATGAMRSARSTVMVPGPLPTSNSRWPWRSSGRR